MKRYIDADRLRAEIKFAKSVYDDPKRVVYGVADAYRQDGRAAMCDDILKRIDSLQQEQPEVDLEKELKNERTKLLDAFGPMNGEQCLAIRNFAHHFYELGIDARKEE